LRWEEAKLKLLASIRGIGSLANGFVTGRASLNLETGAIHPPPQDVENKGTVMVSHLSAMFGLVETCAELLHLFDQKTADTFEKAWLEYCYYFNAPEKEQESRFGAGFGRLILRQGHSRLTAYAAWRLKDLDLAKRAWYEFYTGDGYGPNLPWKHELVPRNVEFASTDEALWISTNLSAMYGLAGIQNIALVGTIETDVGEYE
jgi:hypothetical protein